MGEQSPHTEGVVQVPKECCWHVYSVTRSWPPQKYERCCWCKAERAVPVDADIPHGPYKP